MVKKIFFKFLFSLNIILSIGQSFVFEFNGERKKEKLVAINFTILNEIKLWFHSVFDIMYS